MGKNKQRRALLKQAQEAQERIDYLRHVYKGIRSYLDAQINEILPISSETPKPQVKKVEEMLSLQTQLAKAEEDFNERFHTEAGTNFDFDELRDQIGRALDRIRDAERAVPVLEKPNRIPS